MSRVKERTVKAIPERLLFDLIEYADQEAYDSERTADEADRIHNYDIARNIRHGLAKHQRIANEARALVGLPPYPY